MKKKFICVLIIMIILLSSTTYGAEDFSQETRAVLLGDFESGQIFYEYNIDAQIEIASLTKLMTYLLAMEHVDSGKVSLDDIVTISHTASRTPGSSLKLREGEELTLRTLLDSIMIVSANDSCIAIAEHISGSADAFTKLMNDKAQEIGLANTVYLNPNGYPLKNGVQNMMTTRELFELSRYVISKYPQILETTKINKMLMPSRGYDRDNTNPLLSLISNVDGLKTGFTDEAGYCLISTVEIKEDENNTKPFRLIGIVMGTKTEEIRKNVSKELLEYGLENYSYKQILNKDTSIKKIDILNAKISKVDIYPQKDLNLLVKKGEIIKQEIKLEKFLKAPLKAGDKVGQVHVLDKGGESYIIDLHTKVSVQKISLFDRIYNYFQSKKES